MTKPDNTAERVVRLDDRTFDGWIADHGLLALVLVRSQYCSQSLQLESLIEEAAGGYAGRAYFATIDMDESPQIMTKHGIDGVPTILIFRGSDDPDMICLLCRMGLPPLNELLGLTEPLPEPEVASASVS